MLNSIVIIKKTLNSSIQHPSPNMSFTVHNIKLKTKFKNDLTLLSTLKSNKTK